MPAAMRPRTAAMIIQGRVGFGTSAPDAAYRVHIDGDAYVSGDMVVGSSRTLKENIVTLSADEAHGRPGGA